MLHISVFQTYESESVSLHQSLAYFLSQLSMFFLLLKMKKEIILELLFFIFQCAQMWWLCMTKSV